MFYIKLFMFYKLGRFVFLYVWKTQKTSSVRPKILVFLIILIINYYNNIIFS